MSRYRTPAQRERATTSRGKVPKRARVTVDGREYPACRNCGGACLPPRRTFCGGTLASLSRDGRIRKPGTGCVHAWALRSWPDYARRHVLARDGGVCAACGTDTIMLRAAFTCMMRASPAYTRDPDALVIGAAVAIGYTRGDLGRLSLWEADHIVPVAEGGGETGLENLRTLCLPCHRRATAALAKRMAARRRAEAALRAAIAAGASDADIEHLAAALDAVG